MAVSLYNNIRITMSLHFPLGIAQLADFLVATKRIEVSIICLDLAQVQLRFSYRCSRDLSLLIMQLPYF